MKVIINENIFNESIKLLKEDSTEDYAMDDNIELSGLTKPDDDDDKFDIKKTKLLQQAQNFMNLFNDIKENESQKDNESIVNQIRDMYKSTDKMSMILNQDNPLEFAQLVLSDDKFADSVAQTKLVQKSEIDRNPEAGSKDVKTTYSKIKERIPEIFNKSYKSLTFYELAIILRKIQREFAGEKGVSEFLENIVKRTKDLMSNKYKESKDRIKHYTIHNEDKHALKELNKVGIMVYSFKTMTPNGQEIVRMYVGTNGELTAVAKELPGQRIISMDLHGLPKK